MSVDETILSDLTACRPANRLDRAYRHGTWRLIDYETGQFRGTMVYSGAGMDSGPLTLPLDRDGLHAIHVGVHYPSQFAEVHVRLRLTDDPAYTLIRGEFQSPKDLRGMPPDLAEHHAGKRFADYQLSEVFWKIADLSDQELVISRFNRGADPARKQWAEYFSNLVHVRLVALTGAALEAYERERPRDGTRRLFAMNDGGIFASLSTKVDIRAQVEPYRDSDVDVMLWAPFKGETCSYRSRVARALPVEPNPFDRFGYHDRWHETLERQEAQGVDFMREVVEACHDAGLRVFSSLRFQGPKAVPLEIETGSFYERHPEMRCKDRDGRDVAHLSMAFAEVRDMWIALLLETLELGFDGVHVIFCRSEPFVLYEQPVIDLFRQEHGADPRQVADDDPRLHDTLSRFVTRFARDLRRAVDAAGAKAGRKYEIAANVYGGSGNAGYEAMNMKWGVDVPRLVREQLVEYLIPHPSFMLDTSWLPAMVDLVRGTPVQLRPDLYPRRLPPAVALDAAKTLYDMGCDGITFWDTYARVERVSEWAMMKRLGHREQIDAWREAGKGNDYFGVMDFKWIGDRGGEPRYYQTNG